MGTYDNILPPSRLDKAIDAAIEAENRAFLADDEARDRADAQADAWSHLMEAEKVVAEHGIVLPTALGRDLLRALNGEDSIISTKTLKSMLAFHLDKAEGRAPTTPTQEI
jgi:hypothetical protein